MRTSSETVRETQVRETASVSVIKRTRPSERGRTRDRDRTSVRECQRVRSKENA